MSNDARFIPPDVRPVGCGDPATEYEVNWLGQAGITAARVTGDTIEAYRCGYADGAADLDSVRGEVDRRVERAVQGYRSAVRALARRDFVAAVNALAEDDITRASVRVIVAHLGGGRS